MKVGIDLSNLHSFSKKRGIGYYAENLITALSKTSDIEVIVIEEKITNQNFDLIHYPYFDFFRPTLPLIKKYPTVVTIHDVIPLKFPDKYPPGFKGRLKYLIQRLALTNVKAIITDSVSSKKDIQSVLKIQEQKIFPIYLAPSGYFKQINDQEKLKKIGNIYKLPEKFAVYVGSVNWNKNLINLATACLSADLDLVLVGGDFVKRENLDHVELKSFKNFLSNFSENPRIHILGFVPNEDLVSIYNLAELTLLVSYYEGFGLSILESQACETPVITSNISSMPEVAGEGAILVDPESIDKISKSIKEIMKDRELRKNLTEKGFENVKKFTWEKTALATSEVYIKALNNV